MAPAASRKVPLFVAPVRPRFAAKQVRSRFPQTSPMWPRYCGRLSVISCQGAFDPTKMWALGRIEGASTRVPMATWTHFPSRTRD
jgi:hypothetical protein